MMKFIIPYLLVIILGGAATWLYKENHAIEIGIEQLQKDNKLLEDQVKKVQFEKSHQLQISDSAYAAINATWKLRNDSAMKANHIQQKDILELTDMVQSYRDSLDHLALMSKSVLQPEQIVNGKKDTIPHYKTKFDLKGKCSGIEGIVNSTCKDPTVEITNQTFNNVARIVKVRQKRFLGILWITQHEEQKVFNDCGEVTITDIQFLNHMP